MKKSFLFSGKTMLTAGVLLVSISACKKDDPEETACGDTGVLCNVAGVADQSGGGGNGGSALEAFMYWPMDVAEDTDGNMVVIDFNNHCVRKIDASGNIDVIIGSGALGDDPTGQALDINLNHPTSLTVGPNGDYWLAAWHNWKIKKIDHSSSEVTSPIGTSQGFVGDGGPSSGAKMDLPSSLVFDNDGNIYISDQANQRIRKVDQDMNISTFAGSGDEAFADGVGVNASFNLPKGSNAIPGGKIDISPDKTYLVMADTKNNRIRKIDLATATVTTIAGTGEEGYAGDNGPATQAKLYWPTDVAIGADGAIYIADSKNNVIRKIRTNGVITTIAGTGEAGYSPDGTKAVEAKLNKPSGVFMASDGTLYIADTYNQQIKKLANP